MIDLVLIVEDRLSAVVANIVLKKTGKDYEIRDSLTFPKEKIRKKISDFNRSSKGFPYFVLTDQNTVNDCPPVEIKRRIEGKRSSNLIYRFAVMEIESWIMAHRKAFANFLSVPLNRIPLCTDEIEKPKEFLIGLARKSRSSSVRRDIVPPPGATSAKGPDYNGRLAGFVRQCWDVRRACEHSPSLRRAFRRLREFNPSYG